MPKKTVKRRNAPKRMAKSKMTASELRGAGILKDVEKFLKKNKAVSKGADIASILGVKDAKRVSKAAKSRGFGFSPAGAGLRLPGGSLMLPGARAPTRRRRRVNKKKY